MKKKVSLLIVVMMLLVSVSAFASAEEIVLKPALPVDEADSGASSNTIDPDAFSVLTWLVPALPAAADGAPTTQVVSGDIVDAPAAEDAVEEDGEAPADEPAAEAVEEEPAAEEPVEEEVVEEEPVVEDIVPGPVSDSVFFVEMGTPYNIVLVKTSSDPVKVILANGKEAFAVIYKGIVAPTVLYMRGNTLYNFLGGVVFENVSANDVLFIVD